jgi:hypothetical protein
MCAKTVILAAGFERALARSLGVTLLVSRAS